MSKTDIHVQVIGRPKSGKTTLVQTITDMLGKLDIEHSVHWGVDGPPSTRSAEMLPERARLLAKKSKVILAEIQASRVSGDELNDTKIRVEIKDDYVIVGFRVAGQWLIKNFGVGIVAVERARSLAERVAFICDIEVEDKIPRSYEVKQRGDFDPSQ